MLRKAWDDSTMRGTPYRKKWFDPEMTNLNHPHWERMYVVFEDVDRRTKSILDEVTDSNVSNYNARKLQVNSVEVIFLQSFDLAQGKNQSYA